jgi:D-3-phosphoglycerate dehydrogenase / 2-oxoglutarate reductase
MAAKVVLTDYVWESLDVERRTLEGRATLVPLQTKTPDQFLPEAEDCDALLNTYAGPITANVMARIPRCRIIAREASCPSCWPRPTSSRSTRR